MTRRVTGALLAGGRSTRLGTPKQDVRLHGRTLIEHVHAALAAVTSQQVIVGDCAALSALPRVRDLRPDCGPLGGIEALLASGLDAHYLIVPCDLPRITGSLLARLLQPVATPATVFDRRTHPLPARISAEALSQVRELLDQGERRVRRLMMALEATEVDVPDDAAALLRNVNTPEDLHDVDRALIAATVNRRSS